MNAFDQKLKEYGHYPLTAKEIAALQVNLGYRCNLRCTHCHIEASPERDEIMPLRTIARLIALLRDNDDIKTVDITGGSPELNPFFKYFIQSCTHMGKDIIVRTNLAIYTERGTEDIPDFLAENRVKIIASLPCYSEEGVDSQRGKGTYKKAISALKRLNDLGYGQNGAALSGFPENQFRYQLGYKQNNADLEIDIMFNPAEADIAPDQKILETAYREQLKEMHGITFNHLIALSNMPIGRLGKSISADERAEYMKRLAEKFNPDTVGNIMCRHLISVSPDGKIYDCDFWQMLNLPVNSKCSDVNGFDYRALSGRVIVTNALCFPCTAGAGASCSGALT